MKIIFDYEKDQEKRRNISKEDIDEAGKKIQKLENFLCKKLPLYLEFLTEQEKIGDYVEVHLPIFDYGITLMMSRLNKKFLISVLDHKNSIVYGNLILDGYDCVSIKELKKLGQWSTWRNNELSIFKPDQ